MEPVRKSVEMKAVRKSMEPPGNLEQPRKSGEQPRKSMEQQPRKSSELEPRKSGQSEPRKSGELEPRKSGQSEPRKSGELEPRKSGKSEPRKSGELEPRKSGEQPRKSGELEPRKSGELEPRKSGQSEPRKSGELEPRKSGQSEPRKSGELKPRKSGEQPRKSNESQPRKSGEIEQPRKSLEKPCETPEARKIRELEERKREMDDMYGCHFDFKTTDSDFDIYEQELGPCGLCKRKCDELGGEQEGFEEEEEGEEGIKAEKKKRAKDYWDEKRRLNPLYNPPVLSPEDQVYQGMLTAAQKQYRTDYPVGLHLNKVCAPKPKLKWKTIDNYKTQALADFTPVSSQIRLAKKENVPADEEEEEETILQQQATDTVVCEPNEDDQGHHETECQKPYKDPPPIVSISDEVVVSYLADYNIQMLFEYFLSFCILKTPDDPFQFIADLADKLINGRKNEEAFKAIPRLMSETHVEAMYRLYDRVGSGFISHFQYKNAMGSIGLVKFNQTPEGCMMDEIKQETFVKEAHQGIDDLLRSFLFKKADADPECY